MSLDSEIHNFDGLEGPVSLPPSAGTRPPPSAGIDPAPLELNADGTPKRKRGRPKGSKNRNTHGVLGAALPKEARGLLDIIITNEIELAQIIAKLGFFANVASSETKFEPIAGALGWFEGIDDKGNAVPSKRCLFGAALIWPYMEKTGVLKKITNLPPELLVVLGAIILLGPIVPPTWKMITDSRKPKGIPEIKVEKEGTTNAS